MITFEDFKREAEQFGISLSQWDFVRQEYQEAIDVAKSRHKKYSHLIAEWKKIDAYYSKLLQDEFDGYYEECIYPVYYAY